MMLIWALDSVSYAFGIRFIFSFLSLLTTQYCNVIVWERTLISFSFIISFNLKHSAN